MSIIENGPGGPPSTTWPSYEDRPKTPRTEITFPERERPGVWKTALGVFLGLLLFTGLVLVVMVALNLMFAGSITGIDSGISSGEPYLTP